MRAYELIGGYQLVTTPGVAGLLTPFDFDSFQLRPSDGRLLRVWGREGGEVTYQINSPRFHDNVSIQILAAILPFNHLPDTFGQRLFSGDQLDVSVITQGGIDPAELFLLIAYDDIPDTRTNYIDADEFFRRFTGNLVTAYTLHDTIAAGSTGWVNPLPITQNGNRFKRERQYALVGYNCDHFTTSGAVAWHGFCTGNFRIGNNMAVSTMNDYKNEYFVELSRRTKLPTIPVMNGLDASTFIIDLADVYGTDDVVQFMSIFAELEVRP